MGIHNDTIRMGAGLAAKVVQCTTTYSCGTDDYILEADTTAGAFTITLPPLAQAYNSASATGQIVWIKLSVDNGDLTVDGNGAETIGGSATLTLDDAGDSVGLVATSNDWVILRPAALSASDIADLGVTTGKIANLAVTTAKLNTGVLSADASGRALVATDFFNEATVDDKFAAGAIDGSDRLKSASVGSDRMANPQAYDPGVASIGVLQVAANVSSAETVTIGSDVYEVEIVNTDSNDDTAGGSWNNTTDPLTVSMVVGTYASLNGALAVGDLIRVENEIMRVTVVDGDDVTYARGVSGTTTAVHADANDIYIGDGIAGGSTIAVGLVTTLTPTAFTAAILDDINNTGTESVLAVLSSVNEVIVVSAASAGGAVAASAATTATTETMAGVNNEWGAANLGAGRVAAAKRIAMVSRVPTQTEVDTGNMYFYFPFTVATALVQAKTTSTNALEAITPDIIISGNYVLVNNDGGTDWATTSTVTVLAQE